MFKKSLALLIITFIIGHPLIAQEAIDARDLPTLIGKFSYLIYVTDMNAFHQEMKQLSDNEMTILRESLLITCGPDCMKKGARREVVINIKQRYDEWSHNYPRLSSYSVRILHGLPMILLGATALAAGIKNHVAAAATRLTGKLLIASGVGYLTIDTIVEEGRKYYTELNETDPIKAKLLLGGSIAVPIVLVAGGGTIAGFMVAKIGLANTVSFVGGYYVYNQAEDYVKELTASFFNTNEMNALAYQKLKMISQELSLRYHDEPLDNFLSFFQP